MGHYLVVTRAQQVLHPFFKARTGVAIITTNLIMGRVSASITKPLGLIPVLVGKGVN